MKWQKTSNCYWQQNCIFHKSIDIYFTIELCTKPNPTVFEGILKMFRIRFNFNFHSISQNAYNIRNDIHLITY